MRKPLDYTGQRFGMLTALRPTHRILSSGRKMTAWELRCDCGNEITAMTENLRKGSHKSCGCSRGYYISEGQKTHGATSKYGDKETRQLYSVYSQMNDRCYLRTARNYKWYGALGVTVCDEWRDGDGSLSGFECFIRDMGPRPEGYTLDRIDPFGSYNPSNCRWAPWTTQAVNKRRMHEDRTRL